MTDPTYEDPRIQRRWELAQALIELRSHTWGHVDQIADDLESHETKTFLKVIRTLNGKV